MAFIHQLIPDETWARVLITTILILLWPISTCIYNVYFHPLSKFPGPLLWRAARLPYMRAAWSGRSPFIIRNLHRRYGEVVRIAPDELSFANSAAWEDIYSNRGERNAFPKSRTWHGSPAGSPSSIFTKIDLKEHARARRAMDPGFTEKAVLGQEPIVQHYVDLFINKMRDRIASSRDETTTINVVEWYNYVAFDITGDLGFGEPFNCIEEGRYHEWMSFMFNSIKANYLTISLRHYPLLFNQLMRFVPASAKQKQKKHWAFAVEKTDRRLKSNVERPDIISLMQKQTDKNKDGLPEDEIRANAALLIIAGSETTVTVLTGITNHLIKNPASLKKLTTELRNEFTDLSSITFTAIKHLPYLNAAINEGLRMCNPNPIGHMRISPPEGGNVAGHYVAGNTLVTIHPATIMFSEDHFHEPYSWQPDRWLEGARTDPQSPYHNDDLKAVRAFGHGPQNCIGMPLAWAELRVILAKMLWTFDLKRADTPNAEIDWESQNVFGVIEKKPLDVKLVKRV